MNVVMAAWGDGGTGHFRIYHASLRNKTEITETLSI